MSNFPFIRKIKLMSFCARNSVLDSKLKEIYITTTFNNVCGLLAIVWHKPLKNKAATGF